MKLSTILIMAATLFLSFSAGAEDTLEDKRQDLQRKRIKQGVKSGELTKAEVKVLKKDQKKIKVMEKRAEKDGVITLREKRRLNKAQNRTSKKIFKKKHNKTDRTAKKDRIKNARKKEKRIQAARRKAAAQKKKRIQAARKKQLIKKKKRIALARKKKQTQNND